MTNMILKNPEEHGSVTVIALMILVVLTLLGIMATRTATTDIRIAANEIIYKKNFYIAEAAVNREAMEIGRGKYAPTDISPPVDDYTSDFLGVIKVRPLGTHSSSDLPGDAHVFNGITYDFLVAYVGYFLPPTGYSVIHFSRYDYLVGAQTPVDNVKVVSRYYKIGPKASE
jgi:hypothetical protein